MVLKFFHNFLIDNFPLFCINQLFKADTVINFTMFFYPLLYIRPKFFMIFHIFKKSAFWSKFIALKLLSQKNCLSRYFLKLITITRFFSLHNQQAFVFHFLVDFRTVHEHIVASFYFLPQKDKRRPWNSSNTSLKFAQTMGIFFQNKFPNTQTATRGTGL